MPSGPTKDVSIICESLVLSRLGCKDTRTGESDRTGSLGGVLSSSTSQLLFFKTLFYWGRARPVISG